LFSQARPKTAGANNRAVRFDRADVILANRRAGAEIRAVEAVDVRLAVTTRCATADPTLAGVLAGAGVPILTAGPIGNLLDDAPTFGFDASGSLTCPLRLITDHRHEGTTRFAYAGVGRTSQPVIADERAKHTPAFRDAGVDSARITIITVHGSTGEAAPRVTDTVAGASVAIIT
jgi:hypothetical protein